MLKKAWDWLKKLFTDSLTGALTKLLTVFLSGVIVSLIGVTLVAFASILSRTIPVPSYILAILIFFALIGVLIPVSRIVNILHDYRTRLAPAQKRIEKLKFEEFPREWRAQVWKSDEGWHLEGIEVYCTSHNLRLQPETSKVDPMIARSSILTTSVCSDCKKEGVRYKENSSPGYARHSNLDWQSFEEEIKSRFIRKIEADNL